MLANKTLFPSLKVLGLRGSESHGRGNRIKSTDGARVRFLDQIVY